MLLSSLFNFSFSFREKTTRQDKREQIYTETQIYLINYELFQLDFEPWYDKQLEDLDGFPVLTSLALVFPVYGGYYMKS